MVTYNSSLPQLVARAIKNRRDRLGKHKNIAALLDIPIAVKPGAPSITPVAHPIANEAFRNGAPIQMD